MKNNFKIYCLEVVLCIIVLIFALLIFRLYYLIRTNLVLLYLINCPFYHYEVTVHPFYSFFLFKSMFWYWQIYVYDYYLLGIYFTLLIFNANASLNCRYITWNIVWYIIKFTMTICLLTGMFDPFILTVITSVFRSISTVLFSTLYWPCFFSSYVHFIPIFIVNIPLFISTVSSLITLLLFFK